MLVLVLYLLTGFLFTIFIISNERLNYMIRDKCVILDPTVDFESVKWKISYWTTVTLSGLLWAPLCLGILVSIAIDMCDDNNNDNNSGSAPV